MEMENNTITYRTHRVGSITAGFSMMGYGVLLLLHSLFEIISYNTIFSLWPLMLIGLGLELLLSNFSQRKIIYDKAAVFILIVMTFFAMTMGVVDTCLQATAVHISTGV